MQRARLSTLSELLADASGAPPKQSEHFYLLVDGTRLGKLSDVIARRPALTWTCLFDAAPGSPLFEASPALIHVETDDRAALRMLTDPAHRQSCQLLLSALPLATLARQLANQLYVEEVDGTRWVLALWDPFVMAALIGIQPPLNALVPGPILEPSQQAGLLEGVTAIAFQDRKGELRYFPVPSLPPPAQAPMELTQAQMDMLMDLDLPDRVAALLRQVEPQHPISDAACYQLCCAAIQETRARGRDGLHDHCDSALEMLGELGSTAERRK